MLIITTWLGWCKNWDWHTTLIAGAVFLVGGDGLGSGGHDDSFLSDGPDAAGELHFYNPRL